MNMGWKCPGCGKCYSPSTPQCFTCGQPTYTSNTTSVSYPGATVTIGGVVGTSQVTSQDKNHSEFR